MAGRQKGCYFTITKGMLWRDSGLWGIPKPFTADQIFSQYGHTAQRTHKWASKSLCSLLGAQVHRICTLEWSHLRLSAHRGRGAFFEPLRIQPFQWGTAQTYLPDDKQHQGSNYYMYDAGLSSSKRVQPSSQEDYICILLQTNRPNNTRGDTRWLIAFVRCRSVGRSRCVFAECQVAWLIDVNED